MLPTPRREAEVSAGPEAPRGSGALAVLSSPPPASSCPQGYPVSGTPGSQRTRNAGRGLASLRGAVRASASRGSFRQCKGGGRGGEGRELPLRGEECSGGAGCWAQDAGGAGLSPGRGGRKGSHPSRQPGLPSPRPAPGAPRAGGWRSRGAVGLGLGAAHENLGLTGVSGACAAGLSLPPCAPAWTSCFALRGRGHFAAGRGEGSGIASAAGKWRPGRGRLTGCPGL